MTEDISSPVCNSYPRCTGRVLFANDIYLAFRSADNFTACSLISASHILITIMDISVVQLPAVLADWQQVFSLIPTMYCCPKTLWGGPV